MNNIISIKNPKSPIAEAYRGIRTNIEFSNVDREIKVITVTSSKQNEGKSTVIANIAVSFANLGKRVLILDGDLRNPSVHRLFGISNANGVTELLVNAKSFLECVHQSQVVENLDILTSGKMPANPAEMLSSRRMREMIRELSEFYDYIFIDAPPIGIVTDASIISTYSDGCIFVVGSKEVDVEMCKIAKERLEKVNANILGCVLNKYDDGKGAQGYYNYYYQQEEEPKHRKKKKKK